MQRALAATRLLGAWMPGIAALVAATVMTATEARAEADGPDFLRVTGVGEGSVLNVRSGPGLDHPTVGSLSFDADGIRNLGCEGGPTFAAMAGRERRGARGGPPAPLVPDRARRNGRLGGRMASWRGQRARCRNRRLV